MKYETKAVRSAGIALLVRGVNFLCTPRERKMYETFYTTGHNVSYRIIARKGNHFPLEHEADQSAQNTRYILPLVGEHKNG